MILQNKLLTCLCLCILVHVLHGRDHYVSSGTRLEEVSKIVLEPGDQLLFESGGRFEGMLELDVQGQEDQVIRISSYGEGALPHLDGMGKEAAIRLHNPSFLEVRGLKITNWEGPYGIYFTAKDAGEMQHLLFENLEITRVGKQATEITDPSKSKGGLCGRVRRGKQPSWWKGLTIRKVYVHNLGSCGITLGGDVKLYLTDRDDPYYKPHRQVLIEDCRIDSISRDGIWIRQCERALIQHCEVSRTGMNAISNGIWFWDCLGSVMQYNEGWECGSPRGNDGAPFSIDNHCLDCIIQYNYSHDNEGPGYMIFGREGDGARNILQYNLGYNDNTARTYKTGTACLTICSEVRDALVSGNIIVAGMESHHLLGHRNWEGFPKSVTYRDNLFIGNGKADLQETEAILKAASFSGNLFINVPDLPPELSGQEDPSAYLHFLQRAGELRSTAGIRKGD